MPTGNKSPPKAKAVMYVQQIAHLPVQTFDMLIEYVEQRIRPKCWAAIVHDQDVDEEGKPVAPHIHLMMTFKNARHINSIAKQLQDKPQYLKIWKGNTNNGFAYLIHETTRANGQHQYSSIDVTANFNFPALMQKIGVEVAQAKAERATNVKQLLDMLNVGALTKEQVIKRLSGAQYAYWHHQIDAVAAKRLQDEAAEWRADMEANGKTVTAIWIYGDTGTGKTSLAKEHAKKIQRPYYVAGSSRDPWQSYGGEHTIILDELRPSIIPHQELLRLLDPFGYDTKVMGSSRFYDKALAADLIIITTPFAPTEFFYKAVSDIATDRVGQLMRRLSLIIRMTTQEIVAMRYEPDKEQLAPIPETRRFNPYSQANRPVSASKTIALYNSMFEGAGDET